MKQITSTRILPISIFVPPSLKKLLTKIVPSTGFVSYPEAVRPKDLRGGSFASLRMTGFMRIHLIFYQP